MASVEADMPIVAAAIADGTEIEPEETGEATRGESANEEPICTICLQARDDGTELTALVCGCVFHVYCLDQYKNAAQLSTENLRCPTCRHSMERVMFIERAFLMQPLGLQPDGDETMGQRLANAGIAVRLKWANSFSLKWANRKRDTCFIRCFHASVHHSGIVHFMYHASHYCPFHCFICLPPFIKTYSAV